MSTATALTSDEKERIRYHMGYPNTSVGVGIAFGTVIPIQMLFLVDKALDSILPGSYTKIRELLNTLETMECRMVQATQRFAAARLDTIELRSIDKGHTETDALEREYFRWASRLSDLLGAPLYSMSPRFRPYMSGGGINVPVRH